MSGLWALLAAGLLAGPLSGLDSQQKLLHITVPQKISSNISEESELKYVTYIIEVEGKEYTVHLKQQAFLPQDFMVYTYNKEGTLHSDFPNVKMQCHFQGYIAGFPNSLVTLNTCSGLRGLLQFENKSYGIEPLENAAGFEHLIYQVKNENAKVPLLSENNTESRHKESSYKVHISEEEDQTGSRLLSRYLEMHIIVDKALYDYMGSDMVVVTQKVVQIIGLVNAMFAPFNMTIVLSSLEFWSDKNKIPTTGEADELLQRFLKWKHDYLVLRPHDMAYLLIYKDHPNYVGATFPGKMCHRKYAAGIALYPKMISLETFSVIIAQLLGLNLGISYDDIKKCHCSGAVCIMNPEAVHSSGVKTFSTCSIVDFENFISRPGAECLQNQPHLSPTYRAPTCGNFIKEANEECDCGPPESCTNNRCCDAQSCKLKRGAKCSSGLCCQDCEFQPKGTLCRNIADLECDIKEYCNGTSGLCPPDLHVLNGHLCRSGTAYCYDGGCRNADYQCRKIFGKGSKSAPFSCYEEINIQRDRFGNCGSDNNNYKLCSWKDLLCGKLICTYPSQTPFHILNASVIYAIVRRTICVTLDYRLGPKVKDPLLVENGTSCGPSMYCLNQECREAHFVNSDCDYKVKCHGHGVCNNKNNCHCDPGWLPPDCRERGPGHGGSIDSGHLLKSDIIFTGRAYEDNTRKNWLLLGFYISLPFLIITTIIIVKRNEMKRLCGTEELQSVHQKRAINPVVQANEVHKQPLLQTRDVAAGFARNRGARAGYERASGFISFSDFVPCHVGGFSFGNNKWRGAVNKRSGVSLAWGALD
ncbi:disintegrin and metalloproteinase domain-containing protein 18-like, partial [Tachyglossus aculeatus]|uniref:disintegrin and metalloproteinase domain-containing protein 18-like n=1 Tax=Tachyglossus aculeatus TaxID=9261 RepID=UPI0018F2A336